MPEETTQAPTAEAPTVHPANDRVQEPDFSAPDAQPPAPADTAAAPTDPAPPPEVSKPPETAADRSLQRREAELVRVQQSLKAEREQIARERGEIPRMVQEGIRAALTKFAEKPTDFIKEQGKDLNWMANRILNGDKATPDEEIKALRDEIRSMREERQQERTSAGRAEAESGFYSLIESKDGETPEILDLWGRDEVIRRGHLAADRLRKEAPYATITLQDIHAELAEDAKKEQARISERQKKRSGAQTSKPEGADGKNGLETATAQKSENASGQQEQRPAGATANPTSTLRSTMGSERTSAPAKDILEMSDEDARTMVLRAAEQAVKDVQAKQQNGAGRK